MQFCLNTPKISEVALYIILLPNDRMIYSALKAFTGFAVAARTACQPTVSKATSRAPRAVTKKIHHAMPAW